MNKSFLLAGFLIFGSFLFGTVQEARATIFVGRLADFNVQSRTVGGIAETYVTYDVYDYYDPGAFGWLYYTNPTETIDQDGGFGVNRYLYAYYPGYRADFTTNDYRVNKIVCTTSEHYLRAVYTPTPLVWSDPYGVSTTPPLEYDAAEATIYNSSQLGETTTSSEIILVAIGLPYCVRTPTVQSVTFETINSAVTADNPAFLGGGSRIFPDKQSPADQTNRRTVRVRAQLASSGGTSPYRQGVPVYFRNFDVDDPSDDSVIDPNGNAGNDNNGTPQAGTLNVTSVTTDANGVATVEFTTTMQPGDNFVIAASTDQNYLNGVVVSGTGLQDAQGNQITDSSTRARRSDMLTVWRRLHIEVDSMGASDGNYVLGTIPNGRTAYPRRQITLDVNPSPFQLLEVNRFENGRFIVGGSFDFDVISNTGTTVTVVNNSGIARVIPSNSQFQLYDDDDFNDDDGATGDGTLDGDTGEDIPEPPDSLLQPNDILCSAIVTANCNVFASSYIYPLRYTATDFLDNRIFQPNIEASNFNPAPVRNVFVDFDQIATEADPEFWTIYLYGTYQQNVDADADPDDQDGNGVPHSCGDQSYGVVDSLGPNGQGAAVHMEVGRPREYPPDYANRSVSRAWTAVHEIGHLFGGIHDDEGIMTPSCERTGYEFDPRTVGRLRRTIPHP